MAAAPLHELVWRAFCNARWTHAVQLYVWDNDNSVYKQSLTKPNSSVQSATTVALLSPPCAAATGDGAEGPSLPSGSHAVGADAGATVGSALTIELCPYTIIIHDTSWS